MLEEGLEMLDSRYRGTIKRLTVSDGKHVSSDELESDFNSLKPQS